MTTTNSPMEVHSSPEKRTNYIYGHEESVLRSHRWRTVQNSASFLIPVLRRDSTILDCGCGPGTITADFATYCPDGKVYGVDQNAEVLAEAAANYPSISFKQGDVTKLPFNDDTFDVVFAHALFEYVTDTTKAMTEMKRVCKTGGHVAIRSGDVAAYRMVPSHPGMDLFKKVTAQAFLNTGGNPDVSTRLCEDADKIGFSDIKLSVSSWCFSTVKEREWWSRLWIDRITEGRLGRKWTEYKLVSEDDKKLIVDAFQGLKSYRVGYFDLPGTELLAQK